MATQPATALPWRLIVLNVIGGSAVLASYAYGFSRLGDDVERAWGGVPEWLQPWYVRSMFSAAAGYFPMTYFALFHAAAAGRAGVLAALYAGILVPSALWMPLTAWMIEQPSQPLWWLIRLDLAVVGLCSLGLLALLIIAGPRGRAGAWTLAVVGAIAFCIQTAVLDAVVWPAYFY